MTSNRYKKLGARHKARRRAVEMLFEAEARGEIATVVLGERVALARTEIVPPIADYTHALISGVVENQARIDDLIASHLHEWTLERLPAVDRAIMRAAAWELIYAEDVPPVVAVDEAVELAKELSTDESPGFINGVLGHLVHIVPAMRQADARLQEALAAPDLDDEASTEGAPGAEVAAEEIGDATKIGDANEAPTDEAPEQSASAEDVPASDAPAADEQGSAEPVAGAGTDTTTEQRDW